MSIRDQAIHGAFWSAIQNWGSQAGTLIFFFILARLLSPDAFGLFALANVFLAFMQIFLEQGFSQALIQRQTLEVEHLDTAFWTSLCLGILLTILSFLGANTVADVFDQKELAPIIQGLSPLFLISAFGGVQRSLLERQFAFKAVAARTLIGTLAGGVVGVAMALIGYGVWSLVGQQLTNELVAVLVLWKMSDWRPGLRLSISHFKDLFDFGINILAFNFFNFFDTRSDDFLIGYFLGIVALGFYSIAYKILDAMTQLLVNATTQVALPTFSRLQEDLEQFRKAFYTATRLTSVIAFPAFLGVASLAPELVTALFGEQWLPAVPVMRILSIAGLMRSVSFFQGSVFMAMGKPSWRLWMAVLNSLTKFIGFLIAVRLGIIAVAWSYVISSLMIFPVGQWAISILIKISLLKYFRQFVTPLICSIAMVAMIFIAKLMLDGLTGIFLPLLVCGIVGAATYTLTIRLIDPKLFDKIVGIAQLFILNFSRSKV